MVVTGDGRPGPMRRPSRLMRLVRTARRIEGGRRGSRRPCVLGRRLARSLRWTTGGIRVDFNGDLYVADTEDQGIGLYPAMLLSDSEEQGNDVDATDSEVAVLCVPETPEDMWPSATVVEDAAEKEVRQAAGKEVQQVAEDDVQQVVEEEVQQFAEEEVLQGAVVGAQ